MAAIAVLLAASFVSAQIGMEVMARPSPFIDVAKQARPFQQIDSNELAPADPAGWPKTDAQVIVFDERPYRSWMPPGDDPAAFEPDMSGQYQVIFNGQAEVTGGFGAAIANIRFDRAANRTTLVITLPKSAPPILSLQFRRTRRNPGSAENTGITGLRCIRPGYSSDTQDIFDRAFLDALRPFAYLRFMDWVGTNHPARGPLTWNERRFPSYAMQSGEVAWEYVIALANALHKDIWINIPAAATGEDPQDRNSYVYQLASLLKRDLNPDLNVYVEYSNEVWNDLFPQHAWNLDQAVAEVARGGSPLNSGGVRDPEIWARRRYGKRLYEISRIFTAAFGDAERIRPVFAWWTLQPEQFRDVLQWMSETYGPPRYFWAIAQSDYFDDTGAGPQATVPQILKTMRANSDKGAVYTRRIQQIAVEFGLRHTCYEGGPDNGERSTASAANRILANRTTEMGRLIQRHIRRNWFPYGPVSFTYFGLSSMYARFGSYGATEDYRIVNTPKFKAAASLATGNPAHR